MSTFANAPTTNKESLLQPHARTHARTHALVRPSEALKLAGLESLLSQETVLDVDRVDHLVESNLGNRAKLFALGKPRPAC